MSINRPQIEADIAASARPARDLNSFIAARENCVQHAADLLAELDRRNEYVNLIYRICIESPHKTIEEIKALEPGNTADDCRLIDVWNRAESFRAAVELNKELRAELDRVTARFGLAIHLGGYRIPEEFAALDRPLAKADYLAIGRAELERLEPATEAERAKSRTMGARSAKLPLETYEKLSWIIKDAKDEASEQEKENDK